MSAQAEMWRVTTPEGTFEADLETLKQWIAEGAVIATDKVSKGSLNWIDAGRAPMLRSAFLAKSGNVPAPVTSTQNVEGTEPFVPLANSIAQSGPSYPSSEASNPTASNTCQNHADAPAYYVCRVCAATFCETCPKFVNKVPLCPACGDLCKPFQETRSKVVRQAFQGSGFGFSDFVRALRYPLQHKIALLCGAAIYGFLLLGGLKGQVIAFVIMFGCISQVISQVAWGRLNRSFMPDFSAFSMWDDFAVPLGLGIGIIIVTWGPMILLILVLFFGVFSGGHSPSTALPGTAAQSAGPTEKDLSVLTDPNADAKQLEEANRKLQETRPGSVISREAENSKQQQNDPAAPMRLLLPYLGASIFIVFLFFAFFLWAVFYGPMALTVAGYTQNFGSVINPLVGLDTIRRMRGTYFKAFGMVLLLQAVSFVIALVVAIVTAPFALPFVGNLPAKFIDGSVTFYFNLVIACLLGLSLYKCADRVGITVD
ncbi:MAG TPA: hypothetical protein VE135_04255 [Pyrinomonadaceae bacterium]|nr:hypothetical protein [Pyrinomonadaceae bacterium]